MRVLSHIHTNAPRLLQRVKMLSAVLFLLTHLPSRKNDAFVTDRQAERSLQLEGPRTGTGERTTRRWREEGTAVRRCVSLDTRWAVDGFACACLQLRVKTPTWTPKPALHTAVCRNTPRSFRRASRFRCAKREGYDGDCRSPNQLAGTHEHRRIFCFHSGSIIQKIV